MKDEIMQAMNWLKEEGVDFNEINKKILTDVKASKKILLFLEVALINMKVYSRLEKALACQAYHAIDDLALEMCKDYEIKKNTALVVIKCVAELVGFNVKNKKPENNNTLQNTPDLIVSGNKPPTPNAPNQEKAKQLKEKERRLKQQAKEQERQLKMQKMEREIQLRKQEIQREAERLKAENELKSKKCKKVETFNIDENFTEREYDTSSSMIESRERLFDRREFDTSRESQKTRKYGETPSYDQDFDIQLEVVRNLHTTFDSSKIEEIALKTEYEQVQLEAVRRLHATFNSSELERIALKTKHKSVQLALAKKGIMPSIKSSSTKEDINLKLRSQRSRFKISNTSKKTKFSFLKGDENLKTWTPFFVFLGLYCALSIINGLVEGAGLSDFGYWFIGIIVDSDIMILGVILGGATLISFVVAVLKTIKPIVYFSVLAITIILVVLGFSGWLPSIPNIFNKEDIIMQPFIIEHPEQTQESSNRETFSNAGLTRIRHNPGRDQTYGLEDANGNIIVPAGRYSQITMGSNYLLRVRAIGSGQRFGLIDRSGREVVPAEFYNLDFSEGFWLGRRVGGVSTNEDTNRRCVFFNSLGEDVFSVEWENAQSFRDGFAAVRRNGKWGFIDTTGNVAVSFNYNSSSCITRFSEGLIAVRVDGKWGYINKSENVVIPFTFDEALSFSEGLAAVKSSDKWGFIDISGDVVIPFLYDNAQLFSDGLVAVVSDNKWGFINTTGDLIIPFIYDGASQFINGYALVSQNGMQMRIERSDNVIE
jgi:hypothetical protein